MSELLEDVRLIEEANFTPSVKLVASTAIFSLRYLKELAARLGIRVEDLQPKHIVEDMKVQDALARQFNEPT